MRPIDSRLVTRRALTSAILAAALLSVAGPAAGLTLDWDMVSWTSTATRTETYTVGSGDVTITISDVNNVLDAGSGPAGSPGSVIDSSFLDPTGNNGEENLFLKTDANTASPWVSVTVDFTHTDGVFDVSFALFDVDLLNFFGFGYTDEIVLSATDGTSNYDPSSVVAVTGSPTWTFDGTNTITGTSSAPQSGPGSDDGTAVVTFDDVITSFAFLYKNTLTNGQAQWIGFSDVTFTEGPEPSTHLLLGFGLVTLAAARRSKRL
jgi:hypothetical protein